MTAALFDGTVPGVGKGSRELGEMSTRPVLSLRQQSVIMDALHPVCGDDWDDDDDSFDEDDDDDDDDFFPDDDDDLDAEDDDDDSDDDF